MEPSEDRGGALMPDLLDMAFGLRPRLIFRARRDARRTGDPVACVLCDLIEDAMLDDPRLEGVPAVDISDAALVASQGC